MSEHQEQKWLFDWAWKQTGRHPQLGLMFAVPNGGLRNKLVAKKLKAEGVKAGVPDIFLAVPRGIYHGLFIEMKFGKNKATENQIKWLNSLQLEGYETAICYSWVEAKDIICKYLGIENG